MNAQAFWNVIGYYNQQTWKMQSVLLIVVIFVVALAYLGKIQWIAKFVLGVVNLYIGIMFFGVYGTEPVQYFFAFLLYILCGILFIYESIRNKEDIIEKPNGWRCILRFLYLIYTFISIGLGNSFPQMVTHIMPCPIITLSITVYSGYKKKNKSLMKPICLLIKIDL